MKEMLFGAIDNPDGYFIFITTAETWRKDKHQDDSFDYEVRETMHSLDLSEEEEGKYTPRKYPSRAEWSALIDKLTAAGFKRDSDFESYVDDCTEWEYMDDYWDDDEDDEDEDDYCWGDDEDE